jgi:hypothetical protein
VGRAAPEIDIFEATVQYDKGAVSQSGQWAPFNAGYQWFNTTANFKVPNTEITQQNAYTGGSVFCFFKTRIRERGVLTGRDLSV